MKLTIEIDMDNAAFENEKTGEPDNTSELRWILNELINSLYLYKNIDKYWEYTIFDSNGNETGLAMVEE